MRIWILVLSMSLAFPLSAWAKRAGPKGVKPITHNGIKYRVKHWGTQRGRVEAYDTNAKKVLWSKLVYTIKYNQQLEKDVQDVFIKTMTLKGNLLHIKNERGDQYTLDIKTRAVKVVKGSAVVQKLPQLRERRASCSTFAPKDGAGYYFFLMAFVLFFSTRRVHHS